VGCVWQSLGLRESTAIILHSDHGFSLSEEGSTYLIFLYEDENKVHGNKGPLLMILSQPTCLLLG
jgi:hypothetical protein